MAIDKLVIDRARWGSGGLLRHDGRMCCLGHASLACGIPIEDLNYPSGKIRGLPDVAWDNVNDWMRDPAPRWHRGLRRRDAISINDDNHLSWPDKEIELIKLFADNGVELSFIGEGYQS